MKGGGRTATVRDGKCHRKQTAKGGRPPRKGEKAVQETTGAAETTRAGQTPLGARSNRESNGRPVRLEAVQAAPSDAGLIA